jgi:hypothetical protein
VLPETRDFLNVELVAGIAVLLAAGLVLWSLLRQPDDPDLDEETAGFVAGNWPRIEDHIDDD